MGTASAAHRHSVRGEGLLEGRIAHGEAACWRGNELEALALFMMKND